MSIGKTQITFGEQPWTWITYRVRNVGAANTPAGPIYLRDLTNGVPTTGYMVVNGPIAPGASVDSQFAVGHDNGWPPGAYTVQMEVDYRALISESNEDNNLSNSIAFTVVAACPNPPLNSVVTSHGNTDWHIDTAQEFLFGTDMNGNATAANHCPDTWTSRRHMHVGLTNTARYFYDVDLTPAGLDADLVNGIDTAMLYFYAGHGNPTLWNTLGDDASQASMSLGDCPGTGLLRYYWQCSCEVFAHGPQTCTGSTHEYACPSDYDGSADSANMRNVYQRWGPALQRNLRMACGASTSAYCHETQMNAIWNNYNNLSYDVADSFLAGLHGSTWVVPLCIAAGGADPATSPLYDTVFTNLPNTSGSTHYHIQYIEDFESTAPESRPLSADIPAELPVLQVQAMALPASLSSTAFVTEGDLKLSSAQVADRGPQVRVNQLSGAVYVLGEAVSGAREASLDEAGYISRARRFIEQQGWVERDMGSPTGMRLMIASVPITARPEKGIQSQKNVIITFKRAVRVGNLSVNVLGEGGVMAVQMHNDGSILHASKVWRQMASAEGGVRVKTYNEAYEEALKQIAEPGQYKLDNWMWGYKEEAGNLEQTEMRIVFQFWFVPANPEMQTDYPPQMIEIAGQVR